MKIFTGEVISTKMAKTATVRVIRTVTHPLYKKRYKRSRLYHVHAEAQVAVGDKVSFITCKPYSKVKRWKIIEVPTKKGGKK